MEKKEYIELRDRIYADAIREINEIAENRGIGAGDKVERIRGVLKELEVTLARVKKAEG